MGKKKVIKSIVFLTIGIGLFWYVYKDTNVQSLWIQMAQFNFYWIVVSIALNMLSQLVRAHRWKLMFRPLQYKPRTSNLFLAVLIMAFTNQIIPRGGEIARLGVINRVEKVPFSKLLGIALAERLIDFIILMLIFITLVIWQFSHIKELIALPQFNLRSFSIPQDLLVLISLIFIIIVLVTAIKKFGWFKKVRKKWAEAKRNIGTGFSSLLLIKQKGLYLFESILIYVLWLLMLYVLFFAYPATKALSFQAAVFTFGLATLAFLIPVQAGIGAWHFVVIQCLLLFGVDANNGKVFAIVAHAATNLIYLIAGAMSFALIPIINKTK